MKRKILQFERGHLTEREEEYNQRDTGEEKKKFYKTLSAALDLGGGIVLPIAGGALLGTYLDRLFNTPPVMTIVLLTAGVILGFFRIIRLTRDIS